MSIVVTVRVGEGLVVATDSASALQVLAKGQLAVGKIYNTATKLVQVKDYPIGLATWGSANFGTRSVISLVQEFEEAKLQPLDGKRRLAEKEIKVSQVAEAIRKFLVDSYTKHIPNVEAFPKEQRPSAGFVVGGYSSDGFFAEQYLFAVPEGVLKEVRPDLPDGRPDFGANWFGQTDAIVRLHFGRDDRVFHLLERVGVARQMITQFAELTKTELQYPVVFDGMPLRDAVDYADYLVSVVIGRFRHALGPPICAGPVDLAAISRGTGFRWVRRKQIEAS
jgi:hypothetical protein